MTRRAHDSILFSAMALAVIGGKIISSALSTPHDRGSLAVSGAGSIVADDANTLRDATTPADADENADAPMGNLPGADGEGGITLVPVQSGAPATSSTVSPSPSCDVNPVQHDAPTAAARSFSAW